MRRRNLARALAAQTWLATTPVTHIQGCMAAVPVNGRNVEPICGFAAGALVFAVLKHFSDLAGSAVAQDCYPAFNHQ